MNSHYLLQFFKFDHLADERLRAISERFQTLAIRLDQYLPDNQEKCMALRKLLEAKDCAIRAEIFQPQHVSLD